MVIKLSETDRDPIKKNRGGYFMGRKAKGPYKKRFEKHFEELRWLYMELYDNGSAFLAHS